MSAAKTPRPAVNNSATQCTELRQQRLGCLFTQRCDPRPHMAQSAEMAHQSHAHVRRPVQIPSGLVGSVKHKRITRNQQIKLAKQHLTLTPALWTQGHAQHHLITRQLQIQGALARGRKKARAVTNPDAAGLNQLCIQRPQGGLRH